jgi:hypothetical protein
VKSCKDFNADSIYSPENVSFTPNKAAAAPISHFENESEIDLVEIGQDVHCVFVVCCWGSWQLGDYNPIEN